jgi:hypothetical protein
MARAFYLKIRSEQTNGSTVNLHMTHCALLSAFILLLSWASAIAEERAVAEPTADRQSEQTIAIRKFIEEKLQATESYSVTYEERYFDGCCQHSYTTKLLFERPARILLKTKIPHVPAGHVAVIVTASNDGAIKRYDPRNGCLFTYDNAKLSAYAATRISGLPFDPLQPMASHPRRGAFALERQTEKEYCFSRSWMEKRLPRSDSDEGKLPREMREIMGFSRDDGFPVLWKLFQDGSEVESLVAAEHAIGQAEQDGWKYEFPTKAVISDRTNECLKEFEIEDEDILIPNTADKPTLRR